MRLHLLPFLALTLSLAACASSTAVPRPFPGAPIASAPRGPKAPAGPAAPTAPAPAPGEVPAQVAGETVDSTTPSDYETPGVEGLTAHRFDGRAVAEFALAFRGVPYRFGGADPAGFDCSGLVQYVFAQYGVYVPRVVEEQWEVGDKIKKSRDIKPGDLLFFSTKGPGASHVAIALDTDRFVHAPNSAGVVRIETLSSAYWGSHYLGARRIKPTATTD